MSDPALALRGIVKSFGPAPALRGVDFSLAPGEVHALLGENGAGKSTLLHIAYGLVQPDAGRVEVGGVPVRVPTPRKARALGLGMVHQHFTSIGALTVDENVRLSGGSLGAHLPAGLLSGLSANDRVDGLPVAIRQRLEIVKALASGARILLLDEPSAVLAPQEVEELLRLIREFAASGGAVALITHKLGEVFGAADRVTVLRHGAVTLSGDVQEQTERGLAAAMIGQADPVAVPALPPAAAVGDVQVEVGGIRVSGGELVGVAAIVGNGQRELLRGIVEREHAAFVPEDRTTEGVIPELSLTENLVVGLDRDPRWSRRWTIDWRAARRRADAVISQFEIRTSGPLAPLSSLSGGNQQKVVLARALEGAPRVLVAENPTRGLDIKATAFVHGRLRAAARSGLAVLVYSTDLDEVLELADRVLVVHRGVVREAPREADRQLVGEMMVGVTR